MTYVAISVGGASLLCHVVVFFLMGAMWSSVKTMKKQIHQYEYEKISQSNNAYLSVRE